MERTARSRTPGLALALALALLAPAALTAVGGGTAFFSAEDGDWSDPAVWGGGLPTSADFVSIGHVLSVTQSGAFADAAIVGEGTPGTLFVLGADLETQQVIVGDDALGTVIVDGGALLTSVFSVATSPGAQGQVKVDSGALACDTLALGSSFGDSAVFVVEGGAGSVFADALLSIGASGQLILTPKGPGRAGLQPIVAGSVAFEPGSELTLSLAQANPSLGDSWEILEFNGTLAGMPTVSAFGPYEVALVPTTTGLGIVVTDVPALVDIGGGSVVGDPVELEAQGALTPNSPLTVTVSGAEPPLALAWLSLSPVPFPALGGTVHAHPFTSQFLLDTSAGDVTVNTTWLAGILPGTTFTLQVIAQDGTVPDGLVLSNALRGTAH